MNSMAEKVETRLEGIRREYKELKRGGNVDPSALKEKIRSFIDVVKSRGEGYEELRKEAEDMLIDVMFMIQEGRCAPLKAKSIK